MPVKVPAHPEPFLQVRVHDLALDPSLTALCAGYELGQWRGEQLAKHLMKWLPEFALKFSEWNDINHADAVERIAAAARAVYQSKKFKKRGEFGEILLHVAVRQVFRSIPAISKIYYKDSPNDTVKGFDAVHVVATGTLLELWLGEVKFYENIKRAIAAVVDELGLHLRRNYLRTEFAAITNKIDAEWPHAKRLQKLIDPNVSLDDIFDSVCIPVLLTYDSPTIAKHSKITATFLTEFENEVRAVHSDFVARNLPKNVTVRLLLVPLRHKSALVAHMNGRLKECQAIA